MSYNHLAHETSPYLRQHADNPVHWRPWSDETLRKAREEDKPILLSIGYAACHWCHVMAHESFEDEKTAQLMNTHFINIKVDREERPDIDRYYMDALHMMGERGGWPLTMFLTPDGRPFWGGTYFPPAPAHGRPSFRQVLSEIARLWTNDREKLLHNAAALKQRLEQKNAIKGKGRTPPDDLAPRAAQAIAGHFDPRHGGLSGAPKFPQCPVLELLWTCGGKEEKSHVLNTLTHICQGGIYDHLGGGFSRYSTDERWLAPHFEKMLYDNAQLISLLSETLLESENDLFRQRIEETIGFVLTHMRIPGAGFAASFDADSEGGEGRFYTWSYRELKDIVPRENQKLFFDVYDVTRRGNWEGLTILNRLKHPGLLSSEEEARLATVRKLLLKRREERNPPARDDKVLASWNGLFIAALARAAMILERPDWLEQAVTAFDDVTGKLAAGGGLKQSWLDHPSAHPATADGLANMTAAALMLYQASADRRFLDRAHGWMEHAIRHYLDESGAAFCFTHESVSDAAMRQIFAEDEATPNYNAVMADNLTRLAFLLGQEVYANLADMIIGAFAARAAANPLAHASILKAAYQRANGLQAILFHPEDSRETLDSRETSALLRALLRQSGEIPSILHAWRADDLPDSHPAAAMFEKDKTTAAPALLMCQGQTCTIPVTSPEQTGPALSILTGRAR